MVKLSGVVPVLPSLTLGVLAVTKCSISLSSIINVTLLELPSKYLFPATTEAVIVLPGSTIKLSWANTEKRALVSPGKKFARLFPTPNLYEKVE